MLSQSDFVSMHAPARPECTHMLREEHFRLMKPSSIFVNVGRGPTVHEESLIKALQEGWIAHAGARRAGGRAALPQQPAAADGERDPDARMSPAPPPGSTRRRKRRVGHELALVLSGKWPMSCVNPAVLQDTALRRWQPIGMGRGPNS